MHKFTINMKQLLLFCTFILFSISIYSQQGPPEPAGYFSVYSCDNNFDGISIFNLTDFNPFLDGENPSDYNEAVYYLSAADSNLETNPISSPQSYSNTEQGQFIYVRVNPIDSSNQVLYKVLRLYAWWFIDPIPEISACGENGIVELSSLSNNLLCDLNLTNKVNLSFFQSFNDVNNKTNPITSSGSGVIYVRAEAFNSDEFQISYFNLTVEELPIISKPSDFLVCDDNADGFYEFDLSTKTNEIVSGLTGVLISYHSTMVDAENNTNTLPSLYTNTTNPQTVYARVQDDVNGCALITDFNLNVINQPCYDVAVYLISFVSPRPGFNYRNYLVIKNIGLETVVSGSIEFIKDDLVSLNNVSELSAGNTVTNSATGFSLDFVNLAPGQQETVVVNMNVPVSTPLGTLLTNKATYSVTDLSEENNTSILSEIVIGSYDPNDILESHGPEIFHNEFESTDYLFYTVRFQNVGTADAINVSIDNTLDARLDKSTIHMLSSSHTNVFTRIDNQLNWQFDNIHLPSEDMDEPNSHGYVYYKIKPAAGYSVGDIIPNTAEIYFDFNPAVVTNTFQTEFVATLSNEKINDSKFSIYPNPANNVVKLKFNKNFGKTIETKIYDIQGKMILNSINKLQDNRVQLNVSSLKSGLYFLKVDNGVFKITKKLIIN